MKRAKRKSIKPRNPIARNPLLAKGAAHEPEGKHAKRARQKARLLRELRDRQ